MNAIKLSMAFTCFIAAALALPAQPDAAFSEVLSGMPLDDASIPKNGTFWRVKGLGGKHLLAPLPFNTLSDLNLPVYSLGEGRFLIDDRSVDYIARQKEYEAMRAILGILGGESNEPENDEPESRNPNGIYLDIVAWPLDGKLVSFNTRTGLVYQVQESTNLLEWFAYDTIVANETNESFFLYDGETRYFRVMQLDERIQYPDWDDEVEQFVYFDAWTSIQGTYHLELYADGALVYSHDGTVPGSGKFGVYDGNYNPANWPNAGYYNVGVWEFRAAVTATAALGDTVTNTVQKKFRRPYQMRRGLTIQQYNAFTISYLVQDEIDEYMLGYLLAGMQTSPQVNLQLSPLSWAIDRTHVPKLDSNQAWSDFRFDVYHAGLSDLHYFGHGAKNFLGSGGTTNRLEMWVLERSPYLSTNRMRYVGLDGCNTAEDTTFLNAWIGYKKKVSRSKFQSKGWIPRFGWGWEDEKGLAYANQGTLLDAHFYFVEDYYNYLTHRNPTSGYFDHTYEEAIEFGKHPNGQGINPWATDNSEGNSINYVGCYNCFYDE